MLWWKKKAEKKTPQAKKPLHEPSTKDAQTVEGFIRKAMELAYETKDEHNWIFDIPGSKNEAILSVDKSAEGQAVAVMVRRKASSYVTMHYHFMGSREQVEAFLLDPDHALPMAKSVWELSAAVDDQADEYPFYTIP